VSEGSLEGSEVSEASVEVYEGVIPLAIIMVSPKRMEYSSVRMNIATM